MVYKTVAPPLPDPSSLLVRLVGIMTQCTPVSAAPQHFSKVCYVTWVGGIANGLFLILLTVIIVWLWPYLRSGCQFFSPVRSSFII